MNRFLRRILMVYLRHKVSHIGKPVVLKWPINIEGGKNIKIGDGAEFYANILLQAIHTTDFNPSINIGDNVQLLHNVQISANGNILIGNNVVIAANTFITDTTHPYENIEHAPRYNPLKKLRDVSIGDDTWVGRNVIISGCKIGKHCVVGAFSFVTRDVPDYCVVVGNPARIVKRYNFDTKQWEKTDKDGNFLSKDN